MKLEQASVTIRGRHAWEAIDLGMLLGRRWWSVSAGAVLLASAPVVLLLNAALYAWPFWPALMVWWLKPLFERIPRHVVATGFFGQEQTIQRALREVRWPAPFTLLNQITVGRLVPWRSYLAPIEQLEHLTGAKAHRRATVLGASHGSVAVFLSVMGFVAELSLWGSVYVLLLILLPEGLQGDFLKPDYLAKDVAPWVLVLSNVVLWLAQVAVMPFYVAGGFSLYIKRRIELEGWDLELVFRALANRRKDPWEHLT